MVEFSVARHGARENNGRVSQLVQVSAEFVGIGLDAAATGVEIEGEYQKRVFQVDAGGVGGSVYRFQR
jgi:hypothetical protein